MRQPSLRVTAALLTLGWLNLSAASAPAPARPNVLLICVDDLKPDLGCYGVPLARTPHLDRLAARAMRFDLAYCNQAVCAPSRNHLMLGARSTTLGIYDLSTHFRQAEPGAVTLTQYFMNHGWRAEGVGKILHSGHGNKNDAASWSVPFHPDKVVEYHDAASPHHGQLTREEALFGNEKLGAIASLPRGAAWEALDVPDNAYADGRIADEGIKRLRHAHERPGSPFFLALGFVKPHLPFTAPKKYWDLHDPAHIPLPEFRTPPAGAPPYAGKTLGELNQYEPVPEHPPLEASLRRRLIHGYLASTSYVDAQIGKVLEELERLHLSEKTIVVLWGDHGWHLGDHGMWTKHTNYEQANRIPLLMAIPWITAQGSSTRHPVETVDIYPTLVELAGLPTPKVPQSLDGVSLVPVLKDPSVRLRHHATHAYPRRRKGELVIGRAIRTERYRLVEWKAPGAATNTADLELYDYETDPGETRNLAAERPGVVAELRDLLKRQGEAKPPFQPPGPSKGQ